jgi:DNA-binding response OmpR family regulator
MKIMIIGNRIMAQLFTSYLAPVGIEVANALDCHRGLIKLGKEPHELTLIDSQLSCAKETCQHIRELFAIPVLLLIDRATDWQEMESFHVDGYVLKSVGAEQLLATMRAVLRGAKIQRRKRRENGLENQGSRTNKKRG